MKEFLELLSKLGLPQIVLIAAGIVGVVMWEVWTFKRTKRLQRYNADLEQQLVTLKSTHERDIEMLKARLMQQSQSHTAWYEKEFARIQQIHSNRYEMICELRGLVEEFTHFALRVSEGYGKDLRHNETAYCEKVNEHYWTLRDYARKHHQTLGGDVQDAIIILTDAAKPLIDDCRSAVVEGWNISKLVVQGRCVLKEAKKTGRLLDQIAHQLETPQPPPAH